MIITAVNELHCVFSYYFVMFPYRSRVRTEREERKVEGDLRRSQRACEQLDSQKVREFLYNGGSEFLKCKYEMEVNLHCGRSFFMIAEKLSLF